MSFIDETWLRRAHQAVKAVFDVDEHTRNDMIQFLFDEGFWDRDKLDWTAAITKFRGNCNPSKSEFWKISEVWAISLRFRRPHLMLAMAESMGHATYEIPTEARRQALMTRMVELHERFDEQRAELQADMQRLAVAPVPERLPSVPGQRPIFSMKEETAVERMGAP